MDPLNQRLTELSPRQKEILLQRLQGRGPAPVAAPGLIPPRDPQRGALPLSFAQQRLWFLDQLEPGTALFNIPLATRLMGALDAPALQRALDEMVRRHEVLRTVFDCVDGSPVQVVLPAAPLPVCVVDLEALPQDEREARIQELSSEEARRPFDLARGPLLRATHLRLGAEEHVLLLTIHHIISDGWSMGILMQELAALYDGCAKGEMPVLPELPVQYADVALWQREWLQGDVVDGQLDYWRKQLGGSLPLLELPTDRARPSVPSMRGGQAGFVVSEAVAANLAALSRREGASLFMTLLAAFKLLLSRYARQEDVIVGSAIASRTRREAEGLIGFFVNMLVMRTDLSGDPTFLELLGRVRETALGAYAHQDLPFEKLVEELQPERVLSHTPLFQTTFVLQNAAKQSALELPGLRMQQLPAESGTAKFDLTLSMDERNDGLGGVFEYASDLFDAATVERMAGHFVHLLEQIAADPARRTSTLDLIDRKEERALEDWNAAVPLLPTDVCWQDLFEDQVRSSPLATAVVCGTERLTFGELNARANRLAHALRAHGVGPETLVGLCLERTPRLLVAMLGVLKAGGAYVPLDPAYPRQRLAFTLEDAHPPLLLSEASVRACLPAHGGETLLLDDLEETIASQPAHDPERVVGAENLAYVIYTSGSTGRPKGAAIRHRSLGVLMQWAHGVFSAEELHGVSAVASVCFDFSIFEIFAPLCLGGTLHLAADTLAVTGMASACEVTLLSGVPSAVAELLKTDGLPSSVATVILGGEVLRRSLVERLFALPHVKRVINVYGPTENTVFTTYADLLAGESGEPPLGVTLANSHLYVLDARGRRTPIGVPGELFVSGDGLARGYLNRQELTGERFLANPFEKFGDGRMYRTGDLVRLRLDGTLDFLGRVDQQVKLRGYRIELGEIEAVLAAHPAVEDAAVVVHEDEGDRRLAGYVQLLPEATQENDRGGQWLGELREHLREHLPEHMVPAFLTVLAAMPRTATGKVDRRALPAPARDECAAGTPYVAPITESERCVAAIWQEVLGVARVGLHDNFFDLGGHSLLATQVVSRIDAALGVKLAVRRLFEAPTVAGLVAALQCERPDTSQNDAPPLVARDRDGALPLSFAQQRLWFFDQLEPGSATYTIPMPMRLQGTLDAGALARTLSELLRRHESLRTSFHTEQGVPVQRVAQAAAIEMPVIDLEPLGAAAESEALRLAIEDMQRPFDLAAPPLLRATLVRLAAEDHVLLLTLHHIVSDGWSMGVLMREMVALYEAFVHGSDSPLAELSLQYGDFALWQREWLQGDALEAQLAYWRQQLAGTLPVLELPTDRPRPAVQTFHGAIHPFLLPKRLSDDLLTLSRRQGSSPFMTLLAAYKALLQRYTRQDDVVVGTVIANRNRRELEGLIGFFVNALVMRTDLSGDPSFRELLGRVRETALGAYAHQDLPFEKLVEELQPERAVSHSPLFQTTFVLQNAARETLPQLSGLRISPLPLEGTSAKFDLTVSLSETPEGLSGAFEYNTDLFDAETIRRLAGHYQRLLEGIVAHPERRLSQLPLMGADEERQVLLEWNARVPEAPVDRLWQEQFEAQVERTPNATALVCGHDRVTYAGLNARANRLARLLRTKGAGPNTLVGVCLERTPRLIEALLGVLKSGAAYVPVDPGYPRQRVAFTLEDAQVRLLLTEHAAREAVCDFAGESLVLEDLADALAAEATDDPGVVVSSDDLAYVIYTSGSTGRPKGVAVRHRGLSVNLAWGRSVLAPEELAGVSAVASVCFDFSVFEIFTPLCLGGTLHLAPDALGIVTMPSAGEVTVLSGVPSAIAELVKMDALPRSVRTVLVGGEAVRRSLVERLFALPHVKRVLHMYGPTENTVFATFAELAPGEAGEPALGRPCPNSHVYVLDQQGRPVPIGVAGELCVAGGGVAREYLNRPELTAERFVPNPFETYGDGRMYRSGDLARLRPDGVLEFLGRIDQQVKIRGYRIELGEIETVLAAHAAVEEAVVVVRDEDGDRRLVAYVQPRRTHDAPAGPAELVADLRLHLRAQLPEHMCPPSLVVLREFPRTPAGKVDRRALPAPSRDDRGAAAEYVAPVTELEQRIAALWQELLDVPRVGLNDNFFDLGGHSLLLTRVHARLKQDLQLDVPIVDLFRYPTVSALAQSLGPRAMVVTAPARSAGRAFDEPIAVVGMAGRFPGAADIEQFWSNLCAGIESVVELSDEELNAAGVPAEYQSHPRYVRRAAAIEGIDLFDAAFFGYSPREAEGIDPQQRLFLECSWQALEHAGYDPTRSERRVGVFAGTRTSQYLMGLYGNQKFMELTGAFQASIGNDKDFLPTRVSYKLDLKGPSVSVQTACSTSLVAIHLACRAILSGETEMALAGGVALNVPQKMGYPYQEGGVLSPDGHCRAFDVAAEGCVAGNGLAVVVLKRLSVALADGDQIHALVRGSAINNDGSDKVGFTAPGVEGQAAVIREALASASLEPRDVAYVEAHGTGTKLGDPIELAALKQAYAAAADAPACALGAVKTNIGHLDAAAGVTGFVKAALVLQREEIPPTLHYTAPNPALGIEGSRFFVNDTLRPWRRSETPRRAAVSSFGIGGTNAHVILEEPPLPAPHAAAPEWQLLLLSARAPEALEAARANLAGCLASEESLDLGDVAYTTQVGRRSFEQRLAVVARDSADAVRVLAGGDGAQMAAGVRSETAASVAFMFPGQGSQYAGMAADLYRSEPVFRAEVDRCARILAGHLGLDLRASLFPKSEDCADAGERLRQTSLTQPALFTIEYALARLWMSWGVVPQALIGHSIGEYVAACLAGVFALEDALMLVAARGRLIQALPSGAMLAVPLAEDALRARLAPGLAVAAVNAPALCTVSGPSEIVDLFEAQLAAEGVAARRLHTSHAFHSAMMSPVAAAFTHRVRRVRLNAPMLPFVSNVTGTWIRAEEATDPGYWTRHLCEGVRFADGVALLAQQPGRVLLEVGPGRTLSSLAQMQQAPGGERIVAIPSLRHPEEAAPDRQTLLLALGRLWIAGVTPDWRAHHGERRQRVPLPTYPFQRQSFWVAGDEASPAPALDDKQEAARRRPLSEWLYAPSWRRSTRGASAAGNAPRRRLVFVDAHGVGAELVDRLRALGENVTTVEAGEGFARLGDQRFAVDPHSAADGHALFSALRARDEVPESIVHMWSLHPVSTVSVDFSSFEREQQRGFYSLIRLAQELGREARAALELTVVMNGVHDVTGDEPLAPERGTILGATRVIPQEYLRVTCRSIDVVLPDGDGRQAERLIAQLAAELRGGGESEVALRASHRFVPAYDAVPLPQVEGAAGLREGGVYLVTGGLGKIGLEIAGELARAAHAKLVLVGRTPLPPRAEWEAAIAAGGEGDALRRKLAKLVAIERAGGEIMLAQADVADLEAMRAVVAAAEACFGPIHGIVHAAGPVLGEAFRPLQETDPSACARLFDTKVKGVLVLDQLFAERALDFRVSLSSLSSILGGLGFAGYAAANLFLDAHARWSNRRAPGVQPVWRALNWDGWRFPDDEALAAALGNDLVRTAITPDEGMAVLRSVLASELPEQLVVSTTSLEARLRQWRRSLQEGAASAAAPAAATVHARPSSVSSPYAPPQDDVETRIAEIWSELLGIEPIGRDDHFLDLGGHSLLATQFLSRVREQYQVDLSVRMIYERTTVAGFAAAVRQAQEQRAEEAHVDKLLAELEGVSEEELAALLGAHKDAAPGASQDAGA